MKSVKVAVIAFAVIEAAAIAVAIYKTVSH